MRIIKPNGEIHELSVDEYKQLHNDEVEPVRKYNKKPKVEEPEEKIDAEQEMDFIRKHYKGYQGIKPTWSLAEVDVLRRNKDLSIPDLLKLLPHRSEKAIYKKLGQLNRGDLPKGQQLKPVFVSKRKSPKKFKYNFWTKEELKILTENHGRKITVLRKLLPNHTKGAINVQIFKMKRKGLIDKTYKEAHKEINDKQIDEKSKRLKFIKARVKYYQGLYDWSYEKAFRQGSMDWSVHKAQTLGTVHPAQQTIQPLTPIQWVVYYRENNSPVEVDEKEFDNLDEATAYAEAKRDEFIDLRIYGVRKKQ